MPYKKQPPPLRTTPDRNYWINFLESQGIISEIPIEEPISEASSKSAPQTKEELGGDIQTFIDRVAGRLIPVAGDYDLDTKRKLLTVRERYARELIDVFNGKEALDKWFERTRRELGIHAIDLTRILYECLEGLRSPEAREMRAQYAQTLQQLIGSYQPPT